jgi:tetratricopeptide (TPR) repeat protein
VDDVLNSDPSDAERLRQQAKRHALQGALEDAIACWQRVEQLDPYDGDAPRMIASLTLRRARRGAAGGEANNPSGKGGQPLLATDEAPPSEKNAVATTPPPVPRALVLTQRQELEQAIRNYPEDEANYLKLAELHLGEQRIYDAQRTLIKAMDVCSGVHLLERLEDVNILRAQELVTMAEQRAAAENTTKAHQAVQERRDELDRLQLEVNRARSARNPDDGYLKFLLGMSLKRSGDLKQALDYLRGGMEDRRCRAVASFEIGEILQRYQQFPKALQCYRQAAQLAATDGDQADCRRKSLYRAGVLATEMKLFDSAKGYLTELVRHSPNFKDAATRLDKLGEIDDNL